MSDYVYLKNLNGQQIKPVTDLAAINMTTTNGIGVSTVNGGTIGIIDGYIESAYYTEMADPAVGAANVSSAYVDGGTAVAILGAYTVASAAKTRKILNILRTTPGIVKAKPIGQELRFDYVFGDLHFPVVDPRFC